MKNIPACLCLDSYKLGHADQYPKGTQIVYSNFTPRSTKYLSIPDKFANDTIIAYGMYATVIEIVETFGRTFFNRPWTLIEEEIRRIYPAFVGPNGFKYERLKQLHDLGYLPLHFKTLPEGAHITAQIPVLTVQNTLEDFYWLTNFIETWLSNEAWKPMTSATISWNYRQILDHYAEETGTPEWFVDWQGHDFSLRGMSGMADGAITGTGHLMSFTGSDNVPATWLIDQLYNLNEGEIIAGSVPATEHSVMSCGGKESELETFERIIDTYPTGIVSIVSDTWDFWKVVTEYSKQLYPKIMAREGRIVFRPDSGLPEDILCGIAEPFNPANGKYLWDLGPGYYQNVLDGKYWKIDEDFSLDPIEIKDPWPELKGAVECLWDIFGGVCTETGHKLLNEHIGLIYGDSITMERAYKILDKLSSKGFASGNVVLGIGSYTFQYVTRDTLGSAMKATYAVVNNEARELSKDPATDPGKKSATGLLRVDLIDGKYVLKDWCTLEEETGGELQTIFYNGSFTVEAPYLSDIRIRVKHD